ncbi:MAG: sensor histidine kinase [Azospirillum sp.]|nr:sensor histidine kinase [Azospirillum sp.]
MRLRLATLACLVIATPVVAWLAGDWAATAEREALRGAAAAALVLYQSNLVSALEKHQTVPFVLSEETEIKALLRQPDDAALIDRVNRRLEHVTVTSRASAIYLMDAGGNTLAAGNWNTPTSFIGQNFSYRPYFSDAMAGGVGHYYALGSTSRVPGYYISYPVRSVREVIGVVVVKVGIEELEAAWSHGEERVLVTDSDGIVIISNAPEWRFHTLKPLDSEARARIEASQRYIGAPLDALPIVPARAGDHDELAMFQAKSVEANPRIASVERYLIQGAPVPGSDWYLTVLRRTGTIRLRAASAAVTGGFAATILIFLLFHFWQRRLMWFERLETQRRMRVELEDEVALRTADLTAANRRLKQEIAERRRAEEELRAAQTELVQAAKLAALGEIAAGIAHEINQPLAAIRSFADNAVILLERGRDDATRANLGEIAQLTDRMARITRQLKTFARKASGTLEPVVVADAVEEALALLATRLRAGRVDIVRVWPSGHRLWVIGEVVRLQQVLVNLFRNAVDAMAGRPRRILSIELEEQADRVVMRIRDTGPGIAESELPHLFEPFYTTKGLDEGLGLGLSISRGIVRDFGGTLEAANHPGGGALFTLILRRAEPRA